MSYQLLSEPIRRYIRDLRWDELRPIQNAAISKILTTEGNYILASRTASGKTEAAFLPILSAVDFGEPGVQAMYISPLKALINDQFHRVEDLCKYLDVTVTKWHGEADRTAKTRLLQRPNGVVLITPESIEAMLANKPFNARSLFQNLKFVVVGEIHSFIGNDRGVHLKSLLSRLQKLTCGSFRVVGLSATIGDYEESKRFTGDAEGTTVLLDRGGKEVEASFRYFETTDANLPLELLKDLYKEVHNRKVLVFPNSRGRTEEVAVKLKKISDRVGGHQNYFSHHSSVNKDVREYIEFFAKSTIREDFTISCTSTLELGIDIGSVDAVAQVDATNSVSSMVQRVGRSGRSDDRKSKLFIYSTSGWSLLQSLACWSLFAERTIEPPTIVRQPFDILLHQVLSIVKASSGIRYETLLLQIVENFAFSECDRSEIVQVIEHLLATGLLEKIRYELIIGIEGEPMVNSRDFYSVFETEHELKVVHRGSPIGQVPVSPQIVEGENIFLAARIWKIVHVDFSSMTVEVARASDGKKPNFPGGGVQVHPLIRQRMMDLLYSEDEPSDLDKASLREFIRLRKEFSKFPIENTETDRPYVRKENSIEFFSFTGTRINDSLQLLFGIAGVESTLGHKQSSFELKSSREDTHQIVGMLNFPDEVIDWHLAERLIAYPQLQSFTKYSKYLPTNHQVKLLRQKEYDFEGVRRFLANTRWVEIRS